MLQFENSIFVTGKSVSVTRGIRSDDRLVLLSLLSFGVALGELLLAHRQQMLQFENSIFVTGKSVLVTRSIRSDDRLVLLSLLSFGVALGEQPRVLLALAFEHSNKIVSLAVKLCPLLVETL